MHNVSLKLRAMSFLTLFVISTGNQSFYFHGLHNGNSNKIRNTAISLEVLLRKIHNNAINFKIATNDIFDGFRLGNYFLRNNFVLQVRYEGQQ